MTLNLENSIIETLSIFSFAIVGLLLGIQKILRDWKTTKAESDIITMLHTEIQRMEEQNSRLSSEVHTLQQKIIELSQQITKLTVENTVLNQKVSDLIKELGVRNGSSKN